MRVHEQSFAVLGRHSLDCKGCLVDHPSASDVDAEAFGRTKGSTHLVNTAGAFCMAAVPVLQPGRKMGVGSTAMKLTGGLA